MTIPRRLRLALVTLALGAGACQFLFADSDLIGCLDNLDCPLGQVCNPETSTCVPNSSYRPLSVVDVQVLPAKGSGLPAYQFAAIDLRQLEGELTLQLPEAVLLQGRLDSPEAPGGIPGTLVATRAAEFDAQSLSWNLPVAESGSFSALLAPGRYQMLFKPSNREAFPQLAWEGLELGSESPLLPGYPGFAVPGQDNLGEQDPLLVVCGRVLMHQGHPHPLAGLQVQAVTDTGLRSNLAAPDEFGKFCLRLPLVWQLQPDGDFAPRVPDEVEIVIAPASNETRLPTVRVEAVEITGPELGVFYLGQLPEIMAVSGVVVDWRGRPVGECQLRMEVEPVGAGSFFTMLTVDASGQFATTLPAAPVRITALPPATSQAAMGYFEVTQEQEQINLQLELQPRPLLSGQVTDDAGQPVGEVIVRAQRLSAASGQDDGAYPLFETATGAAGGFVLAVDPGRYSLVMIPPAASGLPRSLPRVAYVTDDTVLEAAATRLPPPTVVNGHIFDNKLNPVCGATVQLFHTADSSTTLLLGETISSSAIRSCEGTFSLLVPADVPYP